MTQGVPEFPGAYKDLFQGNPFGWLAIEFQGACAIFIKASTPDAGRLSHSGTEFRVMLDYGELSKDALVWLSCKIERNDEIPALPIPCFPTAQALERRLLERLGQQAAIDVFIYDERVRPVGHKRVPFDVIQRQRATALLARR